MSEVKYITTTGRYGGISSTPAAKVSNPIPPQFDEEGWVASLAGCAAADGVLFWFWRCEKPDPPAMEIVHAVDSDGALCGTGHAHEWPAGERWSSDEAKVTCEGCKEKMNAALVTP